MKENVLAILAVFLTQAASYGGVTVDFDPTGEYAAQFSAAGYPESSSGGLAGSVGIDLPGGTSPVNGFDGSQSLSFAANAFANGASLTVGAFFKMSALTTEVMRLGPNNGGSDNFAQLPYADILWDGSVAKLDARAVPDTTTFALSTGQWYYFEAIFTRSGDINSTTIDYVITVSNADTNGVVGSLVAKYSVSHSTGVTVTTELNQAIYGAFRQSQSSGVMDNFYVSTTGETQVPPPPPQLVSLNPADGAIAVPGDANLVATFDKDIQAGTGSISIKKASDNSTVESFDVTSSPQLAFSGDQLTIDPTSDLPAGEYYVLIPAGAVEDLSSLAFAGITNAGDWSFGTISLRDVDLVWEPDASANWNTTDVNWDTNGNTVADTAFIQGDRVYFTDSGLAQPTVELAIPLTPILLTVSNTAGSYQLESSSGGYIGGPASLVKRGSSTLYLLTDNDYTGWTLIAGGTLQVGNGGGTGTLGTGNVTNDATLRFNRTNDLTMNAISGTGNLHQDGSGVLTLAGPNALSGAVTINSGILALSNTVPLANVSGITIADGATLRADVVDAVVDAPITLGGINTTSLITAPIGPLASGANSSAQIFTLNGPITGSGNVIFKGLNPFNWTGTIKLGAQSTYSGSTLVTCEDDIVAQFNPPGTDNQNINIMLGINNALPTTTVVTLDGGDGVGSGAGRYTQINLSSRNQTLAGLTSVPRTLRTQRVINPAGASPCTLTLSNTVDCVFSGQLGGNGGSALGSSGTGDNFSLVKSGIGTFTLDRAGGNRYTNGTAINGGTLLVANTSGSGTGTGDVTVHSGGTLGGTGSVSGNVTVNSGGTLSPGTSIGTLTLGGTVVLNAGATSTFEVDGTSLQNDQVTLSGAITYGGVLNIVQSGTFSVGQTFTLFSGAGATSASNFSSITGSPGAGKAFSFTNGVLKVVPQPTIGPVSVSGGNLQGSVPTASGYNYVLQTATNLNPPVVWTSVSTNAGTGSSLPFSVPVGPEAQRFVRFWVY